MILAVAFALRGFNREMATSDPSTNFLKKDVLPNPLGEAVSDLKKDENAAKDAVALATVNIYEPVVHLEKRTLSVGFLISNRQGAQPDIRYGIRLVRYGEGNKSSIDDSFFVDETVSLSEEEKVYKTIQYSPVSLVGTYTVLAVAVTQSGLPLSQVPAGEVIFPSSDYGVFIDKESCALFAGSEAKSYLIDQGIDIASDERVRVNCSVVNRSKESLMVTPSFKMYQRGFFGERVSGDPNASVSEKVLAPGIQNISFEVPLQSIPQAYSVALSLSGKDGSILSNSVEVHYVLRGVSGTIHSVLLDRDFYSKGDTATIQAYATSSADRFYGARGKGSDAGTPLLSVTIQEKNGAACADPVSKGIGQEGDQVIYQIPLLRDCMNPEVVSVLSGRDGELDRRIFSVATRSEANSPVQEKSVASKGEDTAIASSMTITVIVGVSIFLIALTVFFWRRRSAGLAGLVLTLLLGAVPLSLVRADTFTIPGGWFTEGDPPYASAYMSPVTFSVSLDKSVYVIGETIQATGSATLPGCSNGAGGTRLYAAGEWLWAGGGSLIALTDPPGYVSRSVSFPAPSTAGSYRVFFCGESAFFGSYRCYSIPITVVDHVDGSCGSSNLGTFSTAPTTNLCDSGTPSAVSVAAGRWNWSCIGRGSNAVTVPCSANRTPPVVRALTVNSFGAVSVPIVASPLAYAGATNYTRFGIVDGASIALTAPAAFGLANFSSWTGCSSVSGQTCTVFMTMDQTVTAVYFIPPPPVLVRGRITNQATGAGIPGVVIPACAANRGATTDASGNYSFTVPYDARFCIRPSTPVGMNGNPLLSGLQPSQQVSTHTYEWQVAGWNAGIHPLCENFDSVNRIPASCDEWKQWDRSVDTGYDFIYSSLPLPTATLSLNPNPVNIHPTAGTPTVRATWSSTDATSCVATSGNGFVTGGATSSPSGGVIVPTPGAVGKYPYSVRCDGPGGSAVGSDVLEAVSYCNPTTTCTASDICEGESCDNGCDVITGTKDCRKFWKEVAP